MTLKDILKRRRDLLKIDVDVDIVKDDIDLFKELSFDETNIVDALESQAGMVAFYNSLYRQVELEVKQTQRRYDVWYAERYEDAKAELAKSGVLKPNAKAIENQAILGSKREYTIKNNQLERSRYKLGVLKDVLDWWKEKGVMLTQYVKLMGAEGYQIPRSDVEKTQKQEVYELQNRMKQMSK